MGHEAGAKRGRAGAQPGVALSGARFRVLERLGAGGAGEVYRAADSLLGREVALKVLRASAGAAGDAAREARRLAALTHPSIAAVHELTRLRDGRSALVMERVEGPDLAAVLAAGPMAIDEALDLGVALARALAYAHGRGVVHGDLKPANVVLTAGGPKLVDFGFGRLAGEGDGGGEPASGGARGLGSLGYAAPERLRGAAPEPRSDLFSLGCLLYHALAGRPPFAGASRRELVEATLHREAPPLGALCPEAPLGLERQLRRLLTKEPAARPGAAAEVAAELEAIRAGRPRPGGEAGEAPARTAFRGLLSFRETDAGAFFGREQDLRALAALVTAPELRFGVLHGESGSGKTSLLRAGLVPRLRAAGWLPLYSRVYQAPADALAAAALRECGLPAGGPPGGGEPPHRSLERAAEALGAPVLVVLDQLEEAFTALAPAERERLVALVAHFQGPEPAAVRFLVSVRSDFLFLVGEAFDRSVREPLAAAGRYRLRSFSREQAAEVLARSAGAGELAADPDLWPVVAAELVDQGRVLPSELQIVGEAIQHRRLLSAGEYRRAGGKKALVEGFLDEVLAGSGDDRAARAVLAALISPEGTRLPSTREQIRARSGLGPPAVERVLELLSGSRLVRPLHDPSGARFELVHEYLVARVEALGRGELTPGERADRALRRHLSEHAADPKAWIPLRGLWPIYRHAAWRGDLAARRLLARSARRGAGLAAAAALALVVAAAALATPFAVREEWTGRVLSDAHRAPARQAAFSPDGRRLASVGEDGRVLVWDFAARVVVAELPGHTGHLHSVAYSPDGRWLATGGRDGRVLAWDASTLELAAALEGHDSPVGAVGFTPDSARLVASYAEGFPEATLFWRTGSWRRAGGLPSSLSYGTWLFLKPDRIVGPHSGQAFDLATGERVAGPLDATDGFNWTALSADGAAVAGIDAYGWLHVAPAGGQERPARIWAHEDHGRSVAYSPDGLWLATAAEDIVLWDPETLAKVQRLTHSAVVWNLAFSPDGSRLVSTHTDGALLVWDLPERRLEASLGGHSGPVRGVAFSPDGELLATAGEDRTVILWRLADGRKLAVFQGHRTRVSGVDFAGDGRWLASCDQGGSVVVWDVVTRSQRGRFERPVGSELRSCYGLAAAPDRERIAAGQAWFDAGARRLRSFYDEDVVDSTTVYPVRFSPDGRWLARGSDHGHIEIRDARGDRVARRQDVGQPGIGSVDFSPDGERLIVGDGAGELWLYRRQPLERVALLGRHEARIKDAVFSPDGERVASTGDDGRILLWDVRRRVLVATLASLGNPVLDLDFSPDGTLLAAGTNDGTVRLYALRRTLWGVELGAKAGGP